MSASKAELALAHVIDARLHAEVLALAVGAREIDPRIADALSVAVHAVEERLRAAEDALRPEVRQ